VAKRDFKKLHKDLYQPSDKAPALVEVPAMNFAMIDGEGDPNTSEWFTQATEALYGLSYALKFAVKGMDPELDYIVPPLEGLWWADDPESFALEDKSGWLWTLMIMQPEPVDEDMFIDAAVTVQERKDLPGMMEMRFEALDEGRCASIMHVGPYADEGPTVACLHQFIADQDLQLAGKHHEIYLGDPRKTAPEKLKTVIRQPVA